MFSKKRVRVLGAVVLFASATGLAVNAMSASAAPSEVTAPWE